MASLPTILSNDLTKLPVSMPAFPVIAFSAYFTSSATTESNNLHYQVMSESIGGSQDFRLPYWNGVGPAIEYITWGNTFPGGGGFTSADLISNIDAQPGFPNLGTANWSNCLRTSIPYNSHFPQGVWNAYFNTSGSNAGSSAACDSQIVFKLWKSPNLLTGSLVSSPYSYHPVISSSVVTTNFITSSLRTGSGAIIQNLTASFLMDAFSLSNEYLFLVPYLDIRSVSAGGTDAVKFSSGDANAFLKSPAENTSLIAIISP